MSKMSKISIFIRDKKKPVLYMFVGLPASGKSYYTRKLAKKTGASIHSPDDIRRELYGDERIQGDRNTVFNTLHSRIKEDLREGKYTEITPMFSDDYDWKKHTYVVKNEVLALSNYFKDFADDINVCDYHIDFEGVFQQRQVNLCFEKIKEKYENDKGKRTA